MAELKGKFIQLSCGLLASKPEIQAQAVEAVRRHTGKSPEELDPEGWYPVKVMGDVFKCVEEGVSNKVLGWAAIKVVGREVYPTIQKTVGLPSNLTTPLDYIKFEAEGWLQNCRGVDVQPRKFIKTDPGHVVVDACPPPDYNCVLIEGVYEGILEMCGIKNGGCSQKKCVRKGDSTCEYHVKW